MHVKFAGSTNRECFRNSCKRFQLDLLAHPPQNAGKGGPPETGALARMSRGSSKRVIVAAFALSILLALPCFAQDWIRTGTGLGVEKVRLAASDFKPATQDANNAALLKSFNETL